jgi:hypothetical protein
LFVFAHIFITALSNVALAFIQIAVFSVSSLKLDSVNISLEIHFPAPAKLKKVLFIFAPETLPLISSTF